MIVRVNKTDDYTTMSNHHLKNRNLTLKAKGLLSVILSLPDDWNYSISGLAAISKEKENAVNSALKELKEEGYLIITKKLPNETESGRIEYEWDFYEIPQIQKQDEEKQTLEKQGLEIQGLEIQALENLGQLNTNIVNTNIVNTKELSTKDNNCSTEDFFELLPDNSKKKFIPPTIEEVTEYCNQRGNTVDPEGFIAYYTSQNWKKANGRPVIDWKACVITWEKKEARRFDHTTRSGNPFDNLLAEEGYT